MAENKVKTLYSIQALRAIAAGSVVFYHVLKMMVHNGEYTFHVPNAGASGVDLFFVISGFIMIYTCSESFGNSGATALFVRRRFIRIAPTYWLYTSIVVLLLAFFPALFSSTTFHWNSVISSYLFLLSEIRENDIGTLLQTGWTLCYEIYFYIIFAILLNVPRKYFLPTCGSLFLTGYFLGLAVELPIWLSVVSNPILFEFLLGAILALVFLRGQHLSRPIAIAAIILGVCTILLVSKAPFGQWSRVIIWGLPGAAILFGAVSLEQLGLRFPKILVSLGGSSYTLYLSHTLLLPLTGKLWVKLSLAQWLPAEVLFLVAFTASIVTGHVLYLIIERPLTYWISSHIWAKRSSSSVEAEHRKISG
ncbi:MAG: acyltransferase [Porticoccaceae bacterium]|nr:acyltransferase [Porticoccaceae bacterium]